MTAEPDISNAALVETMALISKASAAFKDDWWIIGSAAAHLAGAEVGVVADVDLLLSANDIAVLDAAWTGRQRASAQSSDQFKSAIFIRFEAPLTVEAMSGFSIRDRAGAWHEIKPATRMRASGVFIPQVAEQIALLELMGREKDKARIEALRALF